MFPAYAAVSALLAAAAAPAFGAPSPDQQDPGPLQAVRGGDRPLPALAAPSLQLQVLEQDEEATAPQGSGRRVPEEAPSRLRGHGPAQDREVARGVDRRNLQEYTIRASKVRIQLHGTNTLHMREVQVWDSHGTNVALASNGGMASQSSVYGANPATYGADLAIDGVTSTMMHTNEQQGAWWEVQLDKVYYIEQVKIYNRIYCCGERLSNSAVSLWDKDTAVATAEIGNASDRTEIAFSASEFQALQMDTIRASKVRIQLHGTNILHMREVQVWDNHGTNVALASNGGSASQSSVYGANPAMWGADLAIDGVASTMMHTNEEEGAWWEVQLDKVYDIVQVKIYNRLDGHIVSYGRERLSSRLRNSAVSLWDGDTLVAKAEIGTMTLQTSDEIAFSPSEFQVFCGDIRLPFQEGEHCGEFPGFCLDSNDRRYDRIVFSISSVDHQTCLWRCPASSRYVGCDFQAPALSCLYEAGFVDPGDCSNGAIYCTTNYGGGAGPVAGGDGEADVVCRTHFADNSALRLAGTAGSMPYHEYAEFYYQVDTGTLQTGAVANPQRLIEYAQSLRKAAGWPCYDWENCQ